MFNASAAGVSTTTGMLIVALVLYDRFKCKLEMETFIDERTTLKQVITRLYISAHGHRSDPCKSL